MADSHRLLFVCLGNICRSPTAEGIFNARLAASPLARAVDLDSAGTHGYHVGHAPDPRAVAAAAARGVDLSSLRARRVQEGDFQRFDRILAMDEDNLRILERMRPAGADTTLELMMRHAPDAEHREVPDPYYGGEAGFELMCDLLEAASEGLLHRLETELG